MKVILSRKGFDSGSGGIPSPILANGDLVSLPIPDIDDLFKYSDVFYSDQVTYFDILSQLTNKGLKCGNNIIPLNNDTTCHLDPDLNKQVIKRLKGWKPLYGQIGASQSHLDNNCVDVGDLFIFFGWFKNTTEESGCLSFDRKDKEGKHIIFGYLQIGEIIKTSTLNGDISDWITYHPHYENVTRRNDPKNTIYVAKDTLSWNDNIPGAGMFKIDDSLILSKEGCKRSQWNLPDFFRNSNITYHSDKSWVDDYFKCADRGQEFVIKDNPDVVKWAKRLIEHNCGSTI